ncbi:MAG: HAMP domain-containing protein, partial [Aquabacterium sp.]|nr:HAMP domain-containing protein [Aquabacterium sp.]
MNQFLSRLMMWQKFAILGAIGAILCALPLGLFLRQSLASISATHQEIVGVEVITAIVALPDAIQRTRILPETHPDHKASWTKLASDIDKAQAVVNQYKAELDMTPEFTQVKEHYATLIADMQRAGTSSDKAEDALTESVAGLMSATLDRSGLTLDPEGDTYYLISLTSDIMLQVGDYLSRLNAKSDRLASTEHGNVLLAKNAFADHYFAEVHAGEINELASKIVRFNPSLKAEVDVSKLEVVLTSTLDKAEAILSTDKPDVSTLQALSGDLKNAVSEIVKNRDPTIAVLHRLLQERQSRLSQSTLMLSGSVVALLAIAFMFGAAVIRSVTTPVRRAVDAANAVKNGQLDHVIEVQGTDETAQLLLAIKGMQKSLRESGEREAKILVDSTRIKQALDVAETNVMVADDNYNIVYANAALNNMLRTAESDLRKDLPRFDASTVIGTNIDTFHKNPAHQRGLLDRLTGG